MKKAGLTFKQQEFIKFYLQSFNATKALIEAGYKPNNADKVASNLLKNPVVKIELEKCRERMRNQTVVSANERIELLWTTALAETTNPRDRAYCIEVINKMTGDNAPEKSQNVTVHVSGTIEDLKRAQIEYKDS